MNEIPILKTNRLILRAFSMSDAKDVQSFAGAKEIESTTMLIPHPYEDGMAEKWIATHKKQYDKSEGVNFAITLKKDGQLVGSINLMSITKDHARAELGYWIGTPFWNKGYCSEAGEAVLNYAFKTLMLNRVHAHYLSRNSASGRVMEKLGMKHEGRQKQHIFKSEKYEDIELYGILKEDWCEKA